MPSPEQPGSASLLKDIPCPMAFVEPSGVMASATSCFSALLGIEEVTAAALAERYDVLSVSGEPRRGEDLPWRRAARGLAFDEAQIWLDKRSGERRLIHVQCHPVARGALLLLADQSREPLAFETADVVGSLATALLRARDPHAAAQAIVHQLARSLVADVVALFGVEAGRPSLEILATVGVPPDLYAGRRFVPLDQPFIACEAARTGRMQVIERLDPPPAVCPPAGDLAGIGLQSMVGLPLFDGPELVGVLALGRHDAGRPSALERRILLVASSVCALGLRHAAARSAEHRAFVRLCALREATLAVEAGQPLRDVLRGIVEQARALTGARYGALGILDEHGAAIATFVTSGIGDEAAARIGGTPSGRGLLGLAMRQGRPVRLSDVEAHPAFSGFPANHPTMRSFLAVPLAAGGQCYGSLYLCDKEGASEFSGDDEQLVELFAAHAAMKVRWAREVARVEEEQQRLRAILQHAPEAILFFSTDRRFVFASAGAERLFGQRLDHEVLDRWFEAGGLRHPEGRPYAIEETPVWRAGRGEEPPEEEARLVRPDGTAVPVQVKAAQVRTGSGESLGVVVVLRDLSPFKEVERLRDEFAAIVAHDLRNPISTIQVQLTLLRRRAQGDAVTVTIGELERMQRSAQRLTEMVNDLLDVERVQVRRLDLRPEPVVLHHVVDALLDRLAPTLSSHVVERRLEGRPPRVLVDVGRLDQILTNLLENAAKYSEDGTVISVVVAQDGAGARVSVVDRGQGIAPADIPKLFDRFFQVRRARAKRSGLGLGLYITKELVEAHGGRIWVDSTLGGGSAFHVWFPAAGAP